jgi:hypothetical protein
MLLEFSGGMKRPDLQYQVTARLQCLAPSMSGSGANQVEQERLE